jgi:diaminopimelate decarboxylase
MDKELIRNISEETGTPFYVYDFNKLRDRFYQLKDALPHFAHIYYSVKANPSLAVCQILNKFTNHAEVSSEGEIYCALKAGFQGESIIFSGPGKTKEALYIAIKEGIDINIESIDEIDLINDICREHDLISNVLIRINPDFSSIKNGITMSGVPSQFGVDISEIESVLKTVDKANRLNLSGLAVYLGSQILEAKTIIENSRNILKLFLKLQNEYHLKMEKLNLGGGFGVSYYDDKELDLGELKDGLNNLFDEYKDRLRGVKICFESGRYLVADSGTFITKVLYQKHSKGKDYIICDGGFNNILISSFFTREIRGNFPIALLEQNESSKFGIKKEYYISGPLCSPNDILGSKVVLPCVTTGDLLEIKKVGAYGLTYSPLLFISHAAPAEVLIRGKKYYVIKTKSEMSDLLKNQHRLSSDFLTSEESTVC